MWYDIRVWSDYPAYTSVDALRNGVFEANQGTTNINGDLQATEPIPFVVDGEVIVRSFTVGGVPAGSYTRYRPSAYHHYGVIYNAGGVPQYAGNLGGQNLYS